jgi:hypothetical protein
VQTRPQKVFRYHFEHLLKGLWSKESGAPPYGQWEAVPVGALDAGDTQALAPHDVLHRRITVDIDALADFPAVESVLALERVQATRDLPGIRELLCLASRLPDAATLRHLPNLESLYTVGLCEPPKLDLGALSPGRMRKLSFNRWSTGDLAPLASMHGLQALRMELYRESLDPVAGMPELRYVLVRGPAKGWARLAECRLVEEAHLIEVQLANLRKFSRWERLRDLSLGGRGLASLAGIEQLQGLQELLLLNVRMGDLSLLTSLPALRKLTLRMVPNDVDLRSVARIPGLRHLVIDGPADGEDFQLPDCRPLCQLEQIEHLVLEQCSFVDGDLSPLASLTGLRKLRLGWHSNADLEGLRRARPDLEIDAPEAKRDPELEALREKVGAITLLKPGHGLDQWSIFESFAGRLEVSTNYAAEKRIIAAVKAVDPALAARLDWDTEAGAVGVSGEEADIRALADVINRLLAGRPAP